MMKIKQSAILNVFESLGGLLDDITVKVSKDGFLIKEADRAMVCFTDVKLSPSIFEEFKQEDGDFAINLQGMTEALKRFGKDEVVQMDLEKSRIILSSNGKTFKLALVNTSNREQPDISKMYWSNDVDIDRKVFVDTIADGGLFADSLFIKQDKKGLGFNSTDNSNEFVRMLNTGNTDLTQNVVMDKEGKEKLKEVVSATSRYSMDYLEKMTKKPFGDKVNLKFGKDYPLKLTFSESGKVVSFVLAPRVGEEDEDEDKPKKAAKVEKDDDNEGEEE